MYGSTCTQRVLMAALENGAEYELRLVDIRKDEQKHAQHLARQPFGQIPALEDGDTTLYESRAICRYIDYTRGGALTPTDVKKRALMEQWISLEQGTITPEIAGVVSQCVFAPIFGRKTDEDAVKKHAENAQQGLDVMDQHLATNEYLAGDIFTLADIFYIPFFTWSLRSPEKHLLQSRNNIMRWLNAVTSRSSWKEVAKLSEFTGGK